VVSDADLSEGNASRVEALLDSGSARHVVTCGSLAVLEGRCNGLPVRVATTDPRIAGGSFGEAESECLRDCFTRCLAQRRAMILLLDSAGARLDAGLAGLAAFRRMYRAALDLRLGGVPTVAVAERNCFGGASMLAMLCAARGAWSGSRIGMSGPAIVQALAGMADLAAADPAAVHALFGAPARAQAGAINMLMDHQQAPREVLAALITQAANQGGDIDQQHVRLRQRLQRAGVGVTRIPLTTAAAAFRRGTAVGAADLWRLADAVRSAANRQEMTFEVDCPGQAATRADESVVLSEYVAHLALCLRQHAVRGGAVRLHIVGESAGGIYVAFAAGADQVDASPEASVRVLPVQAVEVVLGRILPDETLDAALQAGVVDRIVAVGSTAAMK
jgi:acetyl-CoA carboxylase beta subunit